MQQFQDLMYLLSDQFTGVKKMEVKIQMDKRCDDCHGSKKISQFNDSELPDLDEPDLLYPDEQPRRIKPMPLRKMIDCPSCNATGIIESDILVNATIEKKAKQNEKEKGSKKS